VSALDSGLAFFPIALLLADGKTGGSIADTPPRFSSG
jgi:hypothetical protein